MRFRRTYLFISSYKVTLTLAKSIRNHVPSNNIKRSSNSSHDTEIGRRYNKIMNNKSKIYATTI